MDTLVADTFDASSSNPLDLAEELAGANDWVFERHNDDELIAAVAGGYCEYQLRFFWKEDGRIFQVANVFDMRIRDAKKPHIFEALSLINERLWIGHFELWSDEHLLMYRNAAIVDDEIQGMAEPHLRKLVEHALTECERFYPVFQFILWAGKSPSEAIKSAMLETVGEA